MQSVDSLDKSGMVYSTREAGWVESGKSGPLSCLVAPASNAVSLSLLDTGASNSGIRAAQHMSCLIGACHDHEFHTHDRQTSPASLEPAYHAFGLKLSLKFASAALNLHFWSHRVHFTD